MNRAESENIAAALLAGGMIATEVPEDADVLILNTCTVTSEADTKNRKVIRSLLRRSAAPLVVTGCAVNVDADFYADIDERILCEPDKGAVPSRAFDLANIDVLAASDGFPSSTCGSGILLNAAQLVDVRTRNAESFRTRADLKIQDGCDNACSYCIVHVARGPARSVPAKQVLEEAQTLFKAGAKELVLVGIDLAAYRDEDVDLAKLTQLLLSRTDMGRVRISSVEPQSITPSLIESFGRFDGHLCRHLHVCLQSGCDKTLREMNRHYDAARFKRIVDELRSAAPSIALSTDIIVGFPGETDDDFDESYSFIEACGFMKLHVFRYSKRPGTPAAMRTDQVDPKVKAVRSDALLALSDKLMLADMERRIGSTEQVVIERPGLGTSESFHTVVCDKSIPIGALESLELYDVDEKRMRLMGR